MTALDAWGLLGPDRDVLDLGCGIGRVAAALSPRVRSVAGLDIAPAMIAAARARCAGIGNLRFLLGSGLDLAPFADRSLDLVLAVDSFPYLVQSGGSSRGEARRRGRPGAAPRRLPRDPELFLPGRRRAGPGRVSAGSPLPTASRWSGRASAPSRSGTASPSISAASPSPLGRGSACRHATERGAACPTLPPPLTAASPPRRRSAPADRQRRVGDEGRHVEAEPARIRLCLRRPRHRPRERVQGRDPVAPRREARHGRGGSRPAARPAAAARRRRSCPPGRARPPPAARRRRRSPSRRARTGGSPRSG